MTETELEVFRQSLQRCKDEADFMDRFYRYFIESSPEIKKKFARVDWNRQYQMVLDSFEHMTNADLTWTDEDPHLRQLAHVHGAHGQAIPAWMFDNWIESLQKAVSETDPEYDDSVEAAWHKAMWKGIAFMKARYNEPLK